jgi:hypothetical protein
MWAGQARDVSNMRRRTLRVLFDTTNKEMRMFKRSPLLTLLALASLLVMQACSDDSSTTPPKETGPSTDGPAADGGPPPGKTLKFLDRQIIQSEESGQYAVIASAPGKVGVAYYKDLPDKEERLCPQPSMKAVQDIMYSQYNGTDWSTPVAVTRTVEGVFGLSMVYDPSGNPHIGYLGGELSVRECASSDSMVASSTDNGATWTESTVNGGVAPGDTAGAWTSVGVDGNGEVQAVFRDMQFGLYTQDGDMRADLRYGRSGEGIAEGRGDGTWAQLLYMPDGTPVVLAFNAQQGGSSPDSGLRLFVRQSSGSWQALQILAGDTKRRPGFATDGNGKFGIAYENGGKLVYRESSGDLSIWSEPRQVTSSVYVQGTDASLAFDSNGNPGVSYYRCSKAGESSCQPDQDGVYFSYRLNGSWKSHEVDTGGNNLCGTYTGLAFGDNNNPFVVYRCVSLNNKTGKFEASVKVAQGAWL